MRKRTHTITWNPSANDDGGTFYDSIINDLEYINWIETESGEEHRAIRLNNILKVFKIFCIEHNLDSFDKLESVLDHKGDLHVSWNEKPNSLEKETISKIWELIGNEDKNNIKHYLLTPVEL